MLNSLVLLTLSFPAFCSHVCIVCCLLCSFILTSSLSVSVFLTHCVSSPPPRPPPHCSGSSSCSSTFVSSFRSSRYSPPPCPTFPHFFISSDLPFLLSSCASVVLLLCSFCLSFSPLFQLVLPPPFRRQPEPSMSELPQNATCEKELKQL